MKFSKGYWWAAIALTVTGAALMWTGYNSALRTQASVTEHAETTEFFDIDTLNIELDAASLHIHADPAAEGITVRMNNMSANTSCSADGNDYLSIRQKSISQHLNFFWPGSVHTDAGSVSVTLPPEKVSAVFVNLGFGDITIEDVQTENLNLESGAGEIKLTSVSADTAQLDSGAGDVTLENCQFPDYTLNQGAGDLTLTNVMLGDAWLTLGMGDFHAEHMTANGELRLENGAGDTDFRQCTFTDEVWMEAGMGDLTMRRTTLNAPLTVENGAGSISLELYGEKSDFAVNANVVGTITYDGVRSGSHIDTDVSGDYEIADPGTSFRTAGTGIPIAIDGVGDVKISFLSEEP